MPNLAFELDQLKTANAHIAAAKRRIAALKLNIARERELGFDTEIAEAVLLAAERGLHVFRMHRRLIDDTIQGIESGALPRS